MFLVISVISEHLHLHNINAQTLVTMTLQSIHDTSGDIPYMSFYTYQRSQQYQLLPSYLDWTFSEVVVCQHFPQQQIYTQQHHMSSLHYSKNWFFAQFQCYMKSPSLRMSSVFHSYNISKLLIHTLLPIMTQLLPLHQPLLTLVNTPC